MAKDPLRYPATNEEIDVLNYEALVHKVFNNLVLKFGEWLRYHKEDLIQAGYIGLIKAKGKYTPGRGSFLGLAYLRIETAIQGEIAGLAKFHCNTTYLENLGSRQGNSGGDNMSWESLFGEGFVNYEVVFRMLSCKKDRKLLTGLVEQYPYWKLRAILKESKEDHEYRVARLRERLVEIVSLLHDNKPL